MSYLSRKSWVSLILIFFLPFPVAANEGTVSGLHLYPVKGVFYPVMEDGTAPRIDSDFRAAVEQGTGAAYFNKRFREVFPEAAVNIDDKNKRRTFAVSLQIARASHYEIIKPNGTVDVYLPISASLYFTNVTTGEVLFTHAGTDIKAATLAGKPDSLRIRQLFSENFQELTSKLVSKAKEQFHPLTLATTVRADWKGLLILDRGADQGFAKDDSLLDDKGNELRVISVGPDYAVAKLELGQAPKGATFTKISNQTLSEIQKPRAMVLVSHSPAGYPPEVLTQLLSDALGAKVGISIVPVNRSFANVLQVLSNDTGLSQQQLRSRELPDFFVRLNVPHVTSFEIPTNVGHITRRTYASQAIAEFADKDGRVLAASTGQDQIVDEVTAGITFEQGARREVSMKNALTDLANNFSRNLKFRHTELAITQGTGNRVVARDDFGVLTTGKEVWAYHSIGKVDGIASEVRVPTWIMEVGEATDLGVDLTPSLPLQNGAPSIGAGDVLIIDSVATPLPVTRKRLGACIQETPGAEKLGAIEVPNFNELALNVFASRFNAPFYISGFSGQLNQVVHAGAGFKSDLKLIDKPFDYCVAPVYRIDPDTAAPCPVGGACGAKMTLRLTYRIRQGAEVKYRHGIESSMTSAEVPVAAAEVARTAALQLDLLDEVLKLTPQIIPKFAADTF